MKIKKISKTLYFVGQFFNKKTLKKLNFQLNDNATDKMDKAHIVLANHGSVMDYRITTFAMRKNKAYHVSAKNIFAGKKWLMQKVGGLPKVQFVPSLSLIKQVKQVLSNGNHVLVFPEGVMSFDGTNRIIPQSVAKLVKHIGVPVAVINIKGMYIAKPRYNESKFNKISKLQADFDVILTEQQIAEMSVEQIYTKIKQDLYFNVWEWNKQNDVKAYGDFVTNLDYLLYECVYCNGQMTSQDGSYYCKKCGRQWKIDEYCRLHNASKELTIAQWFDYQRQNINKQLKADEFCLHSQVKVQQLDGFKGFKEVGFGTFIQGANGVTFEGTIKGKDAQLTFEANKHWAVPAGNNFVELSQYGNTYRFLFKQKGYAIKSAIAVEESFKLAKGKKHMNF